MIRKIVNIDEKKCTGCGACVSACHEGAIAMVNGKAKLIRDDYCDGLGDCLPSCPADAIMIIEREALSYDEQAVKEAQNQKKTDSCGCPGSMAKEIKREDERPIHSHFTESRLSNWPVQIKLVPVSAPYFNDADLLIAADCTAYAYGSFHEKFMRNRITLIGCPKLDGIDYTEKLASIILANEINSVTVTRMEVPCCGGLEMAVKKAIEVSGKNIPLSVITISADGRIL